MTTRLDFSSCYISFHHPVLFASNGLHDGAENNNINNYDVTEYGTNMDQHTMMESDILIPVDENDVLVPNTRNLTKRDGHSFTIETPRGICHRAFSFFFFDPWGKMLLTQRAGSKITFPNVWTNTCCSHPLYDMIPNEVDVVPDAYPDFPGIKHAVLRKMRHELGIASKWIPMEQIQFITRFHYWAADTQTYGTGLDCPWGEHEVDYILFVQSTIPFMARRGDDDSDDAAEHGATINDRIRIQPNPDEVREYKFVTADELRVMMKQPNVLWSPWFRGIMDRGGWDWWDDLVGSCTGKYTNDDVTFFDPPPDHWAVYNLHSHGRETGVLKSN